ncbi:hypothetical protein OF83DRAFT_1205441 [Amylostereum chailletii]|nr:hypothetical protein OF83DRAFT_1205441 [Amylostereum chailletii]
MPSTPASAANLFHPKKKGPKARPPKTYSAPSPNRSTPTASPQPAKEEPTSQLPDGPYTEFRLVSSALNGWKYDVMKFDNRKQVDILTWATPVKLNRKDVRRADANANEVDTSPKAVAPMLGADGKPVVGSDGRVVMVDAEGKPIHAENGTSGRGKGGPGGGGKKKFQRKTKQVFKVPDAVRQLRKEERYPWVLEDSSGQEVWVAQMEEASKAETHGFFMPAPDNTFKFVPAHRWYKFQKKPNYRIPNLEEAESLMAAFNKNKDPERWLLHNRKGQAPSAATSAILKSESIDSPNVGRSLGPGGRRLRTVVNGTSQDLFGDDEDAPRRRRNNDADADYDEVPYEEEFADDEEKVNPAEEVDELTKELEERLQQEYMSANKQRDGHIDADEDEDVDLKLTGAGKSMKKLVSKHEKNDAYDSDEEGDPYPARYEEEETVVSNEPAIQQQATPSRAQSRQPSPPTSQLPTSSSQPPATSNTTSRATSPNPSHGGHSVVAKRATSPKVPKPKTLVTSRANSPLAQGATSPRAASPIATSPRTAPGMASGQQKSNKRKAEDGETNGASSPTISNGEHRAKKRKPAAMLNPDGTPRDLPDEMVVDWLRKNDKVTTRDCITHFTPYLQTPEQKKRFTDLIKKFAVLKDTFLILRTAYRSQGGPPLPGAMDTQ